VRRAVAPFHTYSVKRYSTMRYCTRYKVKRHEEAQNEKRHIGEKPFLEMLIQPKKPNLGQYREVLSEGDAENRETRR